MKETTKSFTLGIIFGLGLALAAGAALLTFVLRPEATAAIAAAKAAQQKVDDEKWLVAMDTSMKAAVKSCSEQPTGFTVLFDSSVSPAQASTGGYELLNLFRPGLGSMLAKTTQQSNRQLVPAWFIVGKAPVIFYGDVNTALVERLDSKGYPLSQGMPLSAAQIAANPRLLEVSQ